MHTVVRLSKPRHLEIILLSACRALPNEMFGDDAGAYCQLNIPEIPGVILDARQDLMVLLDAHAAMDATISGATILPDVAIAFGKHVHTFSNFCTTLHSSGHRSVRWLQVFPVTGQIIVFPSHGSDTAPCTSPDRIPS